MITIKNRVGCKCCLTGPPPRCEQNGVYFTQSSNLDNFDVTGTWGILPIPIGVGEGNAMSSSSGQLLWKNSWQKWDSTVFIEVGFFSVEFINRAAGNPWLYNTFRYNEITLIVDYTDSSNYHKALFDMPANRVKIYSVIDGSETKLLECQMFIDWMEYDYSQFPIVSSYKVPDGQTASSSHFVSIRVDYNENLIIATTWTGVSGNGGGREVAAVRGNLPHGKRAGLIVSSETHIGSIRVETCASPFSPFSDCPICLHNDVNAQLFTNSSITLEISGMEDYHFGIDHYQFSKFNGTYTIPFMPRSAFGGFGSQLSGCGLCREEYYWCYWQCGWALRFDNYPYGALYVAIIGSDPPVAVALVHVNPGGFSISLSKEPAFTDCDSWIMEGTATKCGSGASYIKGTPYMKVSIP